MAKVKPHPRTKTCSNNLSALPNEVISIDSGTVRLELHPPAGVTIFVNDVPSSYLDLDDPAFLAFEYFQQMDAVLASLRPPPTPVKALHLGAAGCSLAWAWDVTRPGSRQVAVDIDPRLVQLVREWFPLPSAPALRLRAQPATDAAASAKPGTYDVIVRDVFSGDATPAELTTEKFIEKVAQALKPDGLYLANRAHRGPIALARDELRDLTEVFPAVAAIAEVGVISGKRYGNVVLAASLGAADTFQNPGLARTLRSLPTPAKIITGSDLNLLL
jgi:spermidine synthase